MNITRTQIDTLQHVLKVTCENLFPLQSVHAHRDGSGIIVDTEVERLVISLDIYPTHHIATVDDRPKPENDGIFVLD